MPDEEKANRPIPRQQGGVPPISRPMWRWFAWYARRFLRKHFHAVRISTAGMPPNVPSDVPLVVYANHPSWWDPMVAIFLADEIWPDRQHYFPIDAGMLQKYRFFGRLGFFGVEPEGRRGGASFLRNASTILETNDACLWITPQGQFSDVRQRPVRFRPGLAHLARRLRRGSVVPVAIEYPFWNERAPEVLLRFGTLTRIDECGDLNVVQWQQLLESSLQHAMDALAEQAVRRDPALFRTMLSGTTGTSRAYDLYRRFRAILVGRRFEASHASDPP